MRCAMPRCELDSPPRCCSRNIGLGLLLYRHAAQAIVGEASLCPLDALLVLRSSMLSRFPTVQSGGVRGVTFYSSVYLMLRE